MARIFQDGFELGVPAQHGTTVVGAYLDSMWQFNQDSVHASTRSLGVQTGVSNSGDYALRIRSQFPYLLSVYRNLGQNLTEHYDRVEFRALVEEAGTECVYHYRDVNFDVVASIRIDEQYALRMFVGTTEVGTIAEAITPEVFARIESRYVVDDTSGHFEVKVNGNSLFSWSGNTDPLTTGNIRYLCLGKIVATDTNITFYYDDIAVNDTTGTVNNSWCGKGSILLLKPKGVGNYSQFTPSAGFNWECVDEVPHDGDTTYVESATADHIDTYDMEELIADLAIDPTDLVVKAVQVCLTGRYEGVDAHLAPMLRSGTTDHEGTQMTMASSYYRLFAEMFSINPFTSAAWTYEEVDALEAGIKHKAHVE